MAIMKISFALLLTALLLSCRSSSVVSPTTVEPYEIPVSKKFAFPVGDGKVLTKKRDGDGWYSATNFGETAHLGEDWNKDSGGNSDCGEPVYSIALGKIVYAENAGPGWGNVIIIEHFLEDGSRVESLYGHLEEVVKRSGSVGFREKIGTVGNANGKYLCHLHLELRTPKSRMWNQVGGGYSDDRSGWLDPTEFITKTR